MEPAGRTVQEEPLRGAKMKVPPWPRSCASSNAAPRKQAVAMGSATNPLSDVSAVVAASSHLTCSGLRSTRESVSRQSQEKQPCERVSVRMRAHASLCNTAAQCVSDGTCGVVITCVVVANRATGCEPSEKAGQLRFLRPLTVKRHCSPCRRIGLQMLVWLFSSQH